MPFAADEVEDGTGKATALVYEQNAAVAAYLERRLAVSSFADAAEEAQQRHQIKATEEVELTLRPYLRSLPLTQGQRLLFPARGAYDSSGRYLDDDPWSQFLAGPLVEAIRLLSEEVAKGTFKQYAGGPPVVSESSMRGSITYRSGVDPNHLATSHPDIWRLVARMRPRL